MKWNKEDFNTSPLIPDSPSENHMASEWLLGRSSYRWRGWTKEWVMSPPQAGCRGTSRFHHATQNVGNLKLWSIYFLDFPFNIMGLWLTMGNWNPNKGSDCILFSKHKHYWPFASFSNDQWFKTLVWEHFQLLLKEWQVFPKTKLSQSDVSNSGHDQTLLRFEVLSTTISFLTLLCSFQIRGWKWLNRN